MNRLPCHIFTHLERGNEDATARVESITHIDGFHAKPYTDDNTFESGIDVFAVIYPILRHYTNEYIKLEQNKQQNKLLGSSCK